MALCKCCRSACLVSWESLVSGRIRNADPPERSINSLLEKPKNLFVFAQQSIVTSSFITGCRCVIIAMHLFKTISVVLPLVWSISASPPHERALNTTEKRYVIIDNDWSTTSFIPILQALDGGLEVLAVTSCKSKPTSSSTHPLIDHQQRQIHGKNNVHTMPSQPSKLVT